MGGSNLASGILKKALTHRLIIEHRDYGLPNFPEALLQQCLVIVSSYSGNTEEALDAFDSALELGLPLAAVSVGGRLIEKAKTQGVPYVQIPDTGLQPRSALGFSLLALLKLLGEEAVLRETEGLQYQLKPQDWEASAKDLALKIKDKVPIIYASLSNLAIAHIWKVTFNETGKIPAFYNVFPELNHNEMASFGATPQSQPLAEKFHFIFLKDEDDDPRIAKRLDKCQKIYGDRGLPVTVLNLEGQSLLDKIFNSAILSAWTAYYTAELYGADPETMPLVEEFKKLIRE